MIMILADDGGRLGKKNKWAKSQIVKIMYKFFK